MDNDITMTATIGNPSEHDNFSSQKLLKVLQELRAPINFFDSLKLAHSIVPQRGDILIIQKALLDEMKQIRGVVVPFWVKGSSFIPTKDEGFVIRGDWQDLLVKYSRRIAERPCTECGEMFHAFKDSDAIMCQKCDAKERFGK